MSTQEVAEKLVAYCQEGKNVDAINELYADDIVSREVKGSPQELAEGKAAVVAKNQHWYDSVSEVHGVSISAPIVTGNFFAVTMEMDVTYKEYGRMTMKEVAVYEAKDGKVIAEQFFYNM
jgi:ketosteroid isomerase-like protein